MALYRSSYLRFFHVRMRAYGFDLGWAGLFSWVWISGPFILKFEFGYLKGWALPKIERLIKSVEMIVSQAGLLLACPLEKFKVI